MYSCIPNDKFPNWSNLEVGNLLSKACNSLLSNSLAFLPLTVTFAPIASLGLTPQVGILLFVIVETGFDPEIVLSSLIAFSILSPGLPTPIFSVILLTKIFFMEFIFYLPMIIQDVFLQQQKHIP